METHAIDLAVFALALPLTMAVVELLKQALLPSRWAGLAAVATGIVTGLLVRSAGIGHGSLALAALTGAIAGLSAAGVWSGTKAMRE